MQHNVQSQRNTLAHYPHPAAIYVKKRPNKLLQSHLGKVVCNISANPQSRLRPLSLEGHLYCFLLHMSAHTLHKLCVSEKSELQVH